MVSARARCWLISLLLPLWLASAAFSDQEGASFFADVRRAYSERPAYADVGEIEITEEVEGVEGSEQHFFETSATRDAGLVWRVMTVSDLGPEDRAVWRTGDSVMLYDGGLRQAKAAASVAGAIEEVLGPAAARAFIVPQLLERGVHSASLEAMASTATVVPPHACFEDRQCRTLSMQFDAGGRIRLTVETGTLWIHDVEVVVQAAGLESATDPTSELAAGSARRSTRTTVRVSHSESSFEDGGSERAAVFAPPPSTLEVSDWESTAPEDAGSPAAREATYYEVVTVDLLSVKARIVDSFGAALPGIEARDLIATVDGQELPVGAVDWYGVPLEPAAEPAGLAPDLGGLPSEPEEAGRLLVIFLQNDFEPSRVKGHMKLFPGLRRIIDNMGLADRVAIVSFFAHLKLWQDFTSDREAAKASLERAFFPGAEPDGVEPGGDLSLLPFFDQEAARDVAYSVDALQFTAEALAAVPGEKDVLYFGYGLEGGNLRRMLRALNGARATVFVLDTTQADAHTLSGTLVSMAASTGGTYGSSFYFADQALHRIERTIAGHYKITIDRSGMPDVAGRLRLRLRDKKGNVLMAPLRLE